MPNARWSRAGALALVAIVACAPGCSDRGTGDPTAYTDPARVEARVRGTLAETAFPIGE